LDSLPPPPPALYADAPGDIYPRNMRERDICARAAEPDWLYLGGLVALDAVVFWAGVRPEIKYSSSLPIRFTGPVMIGLTWGATVGGAWLALPKCSAEWVVASPREGRAAAGPAWGAVEAQPTAPPLSTRVALTLARCASAPSPCATVSQLARVPPQRVAPARPGGELFGSSASAARLAPVRSTASR